MYAALMFYIVMVALRTRQTRRFQQTKPPGIKAVRDSQQKKKNHVLDCMYPT